MRTRSALLAAAALGALCLCALWSLRARRGVDALAPPAIPVPADAVAPAPPVVGPAQGEVPARRDAAEPIAPALSAAAPARERGALEVEVVAADGSPAALARVRALADAEPRPALFGPTADSAAEREGAADEHGRVRFDDLPVGRFEVQAARTAADGRATAARGWVVVDGARSELRLTLAERAALVVRVRDAAREPVAGAEVELVGGAAHPGEQAAAAQLVRATTGADGRVRFEDRDYAGLVAVARAPDGRAGTASLWTRGLVERALASGGIDVVVGAPARLAGRLTGVDAARLASARVAARLLDNATPYYTTHGRAFETAVADGGYAFESLAPGTYTLTLIDPAGARLVLPELKFGDAPMANSLDPIEVELAPGAKVVRDLAVTQGAVLEGLVRDARGAPVADATVLTTFAPSTSNFPDGFVVRGANVWRYDAQGGGDDEHPESHRRARTDAAGAYRIAGLPAGALRVEVAAHGLTYDRREAVPMRDGETVRLEHVLREAGAIAGVFRRSGYLGVQPSTSRLRG